jgi:ribosomal-protein-alanine N-acetyltransferase
MCKNEDKMEIRKMEESDLVQVYAIEQEAFSEPWREEDFRKSMNEPDNGYLVAQVDGCVAGYCGYWGTVLEGYIYNVAVKKEFRRQRIGYHMLKSLIGDAKGRGMTALTLEVRCSNAPAIGLYQQLGFEQVCIRRDFYTRPREDAAIMWLRSIQ